MKLKLFSAAVALTLLLSAIWVVNTQAGSQLRAKATAHSVTLGWTQSVVPPGASPITANNVYRSAVTGAEVLLATTTGPATSFVDTAVNPGTSYFYKVSALNQCNGPAPVAPCESGLSAEVGPETIPNPVAPNPPTNLTGTAQ